MTKSLQMFFTASLLSLLTLFTVTSQAFAQTPPNLGTASTYGAFSGGGAIENTGLTVVTGDIGTHVGAFTGFPPGQYTGAKHVADAASLAAKNDLTLGYNSMNDAAHIIMFDTALNSTMGNGQVLTPRTYGRGNLTTLSGNLTFDAKGNSAAVFIIKIAAALNVAANTHIILLNNAQAANIYWAVDGAVSILDNTIFKGTITANGAIHLYGGASLEGRALAVIGAVTLASNLVSVPGTGSVPPPDRLVVITPAPGDTLTRNAQNYQIKWGGTGIGNTKTLDYSLDGGLTWLRIGVANGDVTSYSWTVADTVTTHGMIRITDNNGLVGKSGEFVIKAGTAVPGSIVITHPVTGDSLSAAQNYQITWTGTSIDAQKTLEYSLDNGVTWTKIATINSDVLSYTWTVPDTGATQALVRITDKNNVKGTSGVFRIVKGSIPTSLVVTNPVAGETIAGGTTGYQIKWSGNGIAALKTIEYSLDNGLTWTVIAIINGEATSQSWNVPDIATTTAIVRVKDGNGLSAQSGVFTITSPTPAGSINSLTLTGLVNNNLANGATLGIAWTYTPDIGPNVLVEFSTDGMNWSTIANNRTEDPSTSSWIAPTSGYFPTVFIRVTSTRGMTRTSAPFSIGTQQAVRNNALAMGYSLSNYPNPVSGNTVIAYALPVASDVTVIVSDAVGREMMRTESKNVSAGTHGITFDATNLLSGAYTYRLMAGGIVLSGKMNVVR